MTFDEMQARESDATVRLAETVSLAVLIEPALLRRARLELERGADPGVEGDVWFSSFVASRDPDGIVFHRVAADGLRRQLATSVDRRRAAWALLREVHATISPALQLEEEIAWLLADESDHATLKIRERLRRAIATMVGGERVGLAHWAVQAIHRLPEVVLDLDETRMLYTAARLRLGGTTGESEVPDWMSWVLPTSHAAKATIRLRMFAGVLELESVPVSAPTPPENMVSAPAVEPLVLEVDGGDGPVPVTIQTGRPTFARIGAGAVRLRASDGAVYELTPSHDLEQRRQREIITFRSLFDEPDHVKALREPLDVLRAASYSAGAGLLVTGPPGSGKTGLLITFVRGLTQPHAMHFFSDRTHQWRDADLAWTSLAAQVERGLPPEATPPMRPVERLRRALHRLARSNVPFVLAIDGLDEMAPTARAADDLDVLFAGGPPPHACVVCSCDHHSGIARKLRVLFDGSSSLEGITLDHEQWRHARIEAARYLGLDQGQTEAFDGNFLACQLAHGGLLTRDALNQALSEALRAKAVDSAHDDFDVVAAVAGAAWALLPVEARGLLGIIAVAREPLTRHRIDDAARGWVPKTDDLFDLIGPWLATGKTPDSETTYVVRHQALRAFIQGAPRSDDDSMRDSHAALLKTVAKWTPRDLGEFQKEYSLRYALTHAIGTSDPADLVDLLTNLDFLEARCHLETPDRLVADLRLIDEASTASILALQVADTLSDFMPHLHDCRAVRTVVDFAMRQYGHASTGRAPALRLRHPVAHPRAAWLEHRGAVNGCAPFGSDKIVSWSADGTIKIWLRRGLTLDRTLTGHTADVTACSVAEDFSEVAGTRTLISGSRDGTVRIWPSNRSVVLSTHDAPIRGVEWTHRGVVSWDAAGVIRISEPGGGEIQSVREHHGAITTCIVEFPYVWSGSEDQTIRVWADLANANLSDLTPEPAFDEASDDGRVVVLVNRVLREKLTAGAPEIVFDMREYQDRAVATRIKIMANLDIAERRQRQQGWIRIRVGQHFYMLKVETIPESGGETIRLTVAKQRASSTVLEGHSAAITALSASASASSVYSCSEDGTIRMWDARRFHEEGVLRGHQSAVLGCEPLDDSTVLSWSRDGTLRVWDLTQKRETIVLRGHRGAVLGASVLSIGQILSWSSDGTLRLWDRKTGSLLAVLEGHAGAVTGAAVLDEASIVSCSDDRSVRHWDPPIWQ